MSQAARKFFNFMLFSRSFTIGNLGVMKDMINGLPRDVRAQIGRDLTAVERKGISGLARRKAIGIFMLDVALFYVGNTLVMRQRVADIGGGRCAHFAAASACMMPKMFPSVSLP